MNHENHGEATLALTVPTENGGLIHQSWTICACGASTIRQRMGEPHHESHADAATVAATAQAVLDTPGTNHFL